MREGGKGEAFASDIPKLQTVSITHAHHTRDMLTSTLFIEENKLI